MSYLEFNSDTDWLVKTNVNWYDLVESESEVASGVDTGRTIVVVALLLTDNYVGFSSYISLHILLVCFGSKVMQFIWLDLT